VSINADKSAEPSSEIEVTPTSAADYVYAVTELAGELKIRAARISRESSKAIFLADGIMLPDSLQTKRLLIKGLDLIARNETEAASEYLKYLHRKIQELEREKVQTKKLIPVAEQFLAEVSSKPTGKILLPEGTDGV
jgi:hypothetical protein